MIGAGGLTKNGTTQVLVTPPQFESLSVMLCVPGPTGVPGGGDWLTVSVPQGLTMQGELEGMVMSGMTALHALVVNWPIRLSCRQPQFTMSSELVTFIVWLQFVALPHRSVSVLTRLTD